MNHDRCPNCEAYTEELDALRADLAKTLVANADHAAELARVEKANALLRAECEAVREMERALDALIVGSLAEDAHAENAVLSDRRQAIDNSRAATDAAGILKGGDLEGRGVMKYQFHWPSVGLELGTKPSDYIAEAIRAKGIREVARLTGLSPTCVSMWASGKFKLPWDSAMSIMRAVDMEDSMWNATIYDRMTAAEKLGWTFHPEDAKNRKESE